MRRGAATMATGEVDGGHQAGRAQGRRRDGGKAAHRLAHQQKPGRVHRVLGRQILGHPQDLLGRGSGGGAVAWCRTGDAVLRVAQGRCFAIAQAQGHGHHKTLAQQEARGRFIALAPVLLAGVAAAAMADDGQRVRARALGVEHGDRQVAADFASERILDAGRHLDDFFMHVFLQGRGLGQQAARGQVQAGANKSSRPGDFLPTQRQVLHA